jgi:hypothetical protein
MSKLVNVDAYINFDPIGPYGRGWCPSTGGPTRYQKWRNYQSLNSVTPHNNTKCMNSLYGDVTDVSKHLMNINSDSNEGEEGAGCDVESYHSYYFIFLRIYYSNPSPRSLTNFRVRLFLRRQFWIMLLFVSRLTSPVHPVAEFLRTVNMT